MKIEIPSHIDATWLVAVIAAFVIAFIVVPQREIERLRKEIEGLKEDIEGIKSQLPGKRLYDAARDGKVAEVRTLCSEWAGNTDALNWRDSYGSRTPLNIACAYDRHEVVSVLIGTAGVDLNMANYYGRSPLWLAAFCGKTQSVRVLLSAKERGLDLNQKPTGGGYIGKTPLKIAREENKAEVVALLEAAGARDV